MSRFSFLVPPFVLGVSCVAVPLAIYPLVFPKKLFLYHTKTYDQGIRDGYDKARTEIQLQSQKAVSKTLHYIEDDYNTIANSKTSLVPDQFIQGKIKILLLPKYNLNLLGDDYVIRQTLRPDFKNAWIMTKEDSEYMDKVILKTLDKVNHCYSDEQKIGLIQTKHREDIDRLLAENCNAIWRK